MAGRCSATTALKIRGGSMRRRKGTRGGGEGEKKEGRMEYGAGVKDRRTGREEREESL